MKLIRFAAIGAIALAIPGLCFATSCSGWKLKRGKMLSMMDALCVYENDGVERKFIIGGFCTKYLPIPECGKVRPEMVKELKPGSKDPEK